MRKLIIIIAMMAASAVGFAQVNASAAKPQNHSKRPDVRAIVGPSIAATDRSWRARIHYTYLQRDEERRLDSHGLVKSDDLEVSTIIFFQWCSVRATRGTQRTASISRRTKETKGPAQQAEARDSRGASRSA